MARKRLPRADQALLNVPPDVAAERVANQVEGEIPIITGGDPPDDPKWGRIRRVIVRDTSNPNANYVLPITISSNAGTFHRMIRVNAEIDLPEDICKSINATAVIRHEQLVSLESGLYSVRDPDAVDQKMNPGTRLRRDSAGLLYRIRETPRYVVTPVL